jgi:hypothetical protein
MIGEKRIETRSWSTKFTATIAIHASKSFPDGDMDLCSEWPFKEALKAASIHGPCDLPRGMILGTARIVVCRPASLIEPHISEQEKAFGNYGPSRFAWFLAEPFILAKPVPCRGALGLWEVPEAIAVEVIRGL